MSSFVVLQLSRYWYLVLVDNLKEISRIAQRIQASLPPSSLGNSLYCLETPSTGKSSSSDSRNYHHIMCKEVNNVNVFILFSTLK